MAWTCRHAQHRVEALAATGAVLALDDTADDDEDDATGRLCSLASGGRATASRVAADSGVIWRVAAARCICTSASDASRSTAVVT